MPFVADEKDVKLRAGVARLRGDRAQLVDATIVIPVNAQGDLENALRVVADLGAYEGEHRFELILVVNNYPKNEPPMRIIQHYEQLGIRVVSVPSVRRLGEAVGFSARIPGVGAAESETVILFDADVRIPNATILLDWYVAQFRAGAGAAYTHVDYYELPKDLSIRVRLAIHHFTRWVKRNLLGIPTTRGGSYAVTQSIMLRLYEEGMLADELNVGPTFKRMGHRVVYSGDRRLKVLTSGRMFSEGWRRMLPYYWYRLKYNLRTLPVRNNVASYTGRKNKVIRRYVNNRPMN